MLQNIIGNYKDFFSCFYIVLFFKFRLANENAFKEVQAKMRAVQKENDDLKTALGKKERECEVKIEESVRYNCCIHSVTMETLQFSSFDKESL
jgi:hypothetical protein